MTSTTIDWDNRSLLQREVSTMYELRKILVDETNQVSNSAPMTNTIGETAGIFAGGAPMAPFASTVGRFRAFSFPFPGSVLVSLAYLSPSNCDIHPPWPPFPGFTYHATSTTGFWHNRAVTHIHFPTTEDMITEYLYFWALPNTLPGLLRRNPPPAIRRMDVRVVEDRPLPNDMRVDTTFLVIQMRQLRYVIVAKPQDLELEPPSPISIPPDTKPSI